MQQAGRWTSHSGRNIFRFLFNPAGWRQEKSLIGAHNIFIVSFQISLYTYTYKGGGVVRALESGLSSDTPIFFLSYFPNKATFELPNHGRVCTKHFMGYKCGGPFDGVCVSVYWREIPKKLLCCVTWCVYIVRGVIYNRRSSKGNFWKKFSHGFLIYSPFVL